jgi:hypothetical protein
MTDEEFEKAKQVTVVTAQRAAERQAAEAQARKAAAAARGDIFPPQPG